jgi:hypothetical protein
MSAFFGYPFTFRRGQQHPCLVLCGPCRRAERGQTSAKGSRGGMGTDEMVLADGWEVVVHEDARFIPRPFEIARGRAVGSHVPRAALHRQYTVLRQSPTEIRVVR